MQKGIFDKMSHIITTWFCTKTWLSVYKKKEHPVSWMLSQSWRLPTLPLGIAVPSALTGLTSLFGMGRGGSPSLLPPLFIACLWLFNVRHSLYGVREKKDFGLFCFVYLIFLHTLHNWSVGLLVPLDFDITAFTSAAYQRGSLPRPYLEISSRG